MASQFRAVLRDGETGLTGSASQFIQVPDLSKNRLALSGLVLTTPKTIANMSLAAGDNNSSKDAAAVITDCLAKKKFARVEQWMDFSVR